MRTAFLALLTLLAFSTDAQAEGSLVDPAVQRLSKAVEASCLSQREQVLDQIRQANPAHVPLVSALDFPGYCACLRNAVVGRVSPSLAKSGTEADAEALMQEIGSTCAGNSMKLAFTRSICRTLPAVLDLPTKPSAESTASACSCVEATTANLTARDLFESVTQTGQDILELQQGRSLRNLQPKSLIPQLRACLELQPLQR